MRIRFLNPTPNAGYDPAKIEKQLNQYASPGTEVKIGFPDDYVGSKVVGYLSEKSNLNGLHHIMEAPSLIKKIVWASENGFDAVIQSNTFDPGVEGARGAVKIPVIGLLRTTLHAASTIADKIGVVVPLATHISYTRRLIRFYGMGDFIAGIRPIGVYGSGLDKRKKEITDITIGVIRKLIDDGAQVILPLGGLLIPYVVDPVELEQATNAPVLNTKAIGINFAELCVRMGMMQSPLTYTPIDGLKHEYFEQSAFGA